MIPLPIDPLLGELVSTLKRAPALVLQAPPGAGKTTRVPRALLDAGFADKGDILVLEPRRLAARMSARRVAFELGEDVGQRVGYQVRFEDVSSDKTRVRFMTEGLLTRKLSSDPQLRGVSCVLLDEFHERHIHTDLALALVARLQRSSRPDLKLIVMSATLDTNEVSAYLGGAPTMRSEGRAYPVEIEHQTRPDERPLGGRVTAAVRQLVSSDPGDVLVFLPGAAEIRRAHEALGGLATEKRLKVVVLHGELSAKEQDEAIKKSGQQKVILSTNVAETSVTIEGVTGVVDSGLARVASHSPWSGMSQLKLGQISQASATQRAGRAGRTAPGRCIRLFTLHDYNAAPAFTAPEMARVDLADTQLLLHALLGAEHLDFLTPPDLAAVDTADRLLERLGALSLDRKVTDLGRRMLRFAVHPRQSRLLIEAEARGVGREGALLAALLGERDIRRANLNEMRQAKISASSDLVYLMELFQRAEKEHFSSQALQHFGLDAGSVQTVKRLREQLLRQIDQRAHAPKGAAHEVALLKSVLAAFPDRVGRKRMAASGSSNRSVEVVFASGGSALLSEASVVNDDDWLVAVEAEERVQGGSRKSVVQKASAIQVDWLLDLFLERIDERREVSWNAKDERVEAVRRLYYDDFVIEESPELRADAEAVAALLFQNIKSKGLRGLCDVEAFDRFVQRVAFVRKHRPELAYPAFDETTLAEALKQACAGKRSLRELREDSLLAYLEALLSHEQQRKLNEFAPERIQLPGGRKAPIEYPADQAPFASSRLQDFFGMKAGPSIAGGRVPLVLHLLAPNQRAVQVTTDLSGFWGRHYPAIAKELRRKYPRHAWPDDPLTATPPAPRK